MKVARLDSSIEKQILTAMIVNDSVLSRIASKWNRDGLFSSPWSNEIAKLCIRYWTKYQKAPGKAIQSLYERYISDGDPEVAEMVARFLSSLSNEYSRIGAEINAPYIIDQADEVFNKIRLKRLVEGVQSDLDANDLSQAIKKWSEFNQVSIGSGSAIDILDSSMIPSVYKAKGESLIEYPGALGSFVNHIMVRDSFLALMAPEKTGKTWWLIEFAWRAYLQGRRVAFFEVGDMSEAQLLNRFYVKIAKTPDEAGEIKIPTSIETDPDNPKEMEVFFDERNCTTPLNPDIAKDAVERVLKKRGGNRLRLSVHPNTSINVMGIQSILSEWEQAEWVPDVVVIDYADILAPPSGNLESRDQINLTWKQLRSLSQLKHCLLITATQADAASYGSGLLTKKNFSEDKRKYAHVNGMLGLNVSEEDKEKQITRLNWLVLRERKFSEAKCCHVAGCLGIGAPALVSAF